MVVFWHLVQDFFSRIYLFLRHPSLKGRTKYQWEDFEFEIRTGTSDYFVIDEILLHNTYKFEVPEGGIVLDIGANIGVYSLFAARKAAQVIAYEPESSNFQQLLKHIEINNIQNINAINKAVGGSAKKVKLYVVAANRGRSSTTGHNSATIQEVDQVDINEVFTKYDIEKLDILKIDIEGGEYEIFAAISDENLARVRRIAIEYHPISGHKVSEIAGRLTNAGFVIETERSLLQRLVGTGMLYATRA